MNKGVSYYMSLPYKTKLAKIPDCEGGGYAAYIPQLGPDFIGEGDTEEEAFNKLEIVKELQFKERLRKKEEIKEPK
jgi:predicted RNase H-like HicB family nuclease